MGLSFKDSLNKVKENNNARMINNNISPMNPIERTYNSSQQSYFDEMQKSKNLI